MRAVTLVRSAEKPLRSLRLLAGAPNAGGVVAALVLLAGAQALTLAFVHPPLDTTPAPADAVVVLAGDHGDRLDAALALMHDGTAPTLVILRPSDGANELARPLCAGGAAFQVMCVDPTRINTLGDGKEIAQLARDNAWDQVVVVTSRFHALRAGVIVRRCADTADAGLAVAIVPSKPAFGLRQWLKAITHELLGLGQAAVLHRGC